MAQGVDLRHYSRQIEKDLAAVEEESISDCTCVRAFWAALSSTRVVPVADVRESDHIAQLFNQISSCETILVSMEEMLQGFRSNLGGISQEIKNLQNDSLAMNVKLANRRAVHGRISTFLEKVAVSEDMIVAICEVRASCAAV